MSPTTPPLFSLVVGTKGRSTELARLLESLAAQTCTDFELLVVDQNPDDRVERVLDAFRSRLPIRHFHVAFSGLSRARNLALASAGGSLIAFPDDDCWFPPQTLQTAAELLAAEPGVHGICGRSEVPGGQASQLRSGSRPRLLNRFNVWDLAISYTIFLRRDVVRAVGEFDETLGVGAGTAWGSGEETDYLLRALALGHRLRYEPRLVVWHPALPRVHTPQTWSRGLLYGAGLGRVLRKNAAPPWFALVMLLRALAGVAVGLGLLRPGMARFHLNVLRGRWSGWRAADEPGRKA
jgi:glycosyltransferase involved in cell wall biosynthesis